MEPQLFNLEQLLDYMEIRISTLHHLISDRDFPAGKPNGNTDTRLWSRVEVDR